MGSGSSRTKKKSKLKQEFKNTNLSDNPKLKKSEIETKEFQTLAIHDTNHLPKVKNVDKNNSKLKSLQISKDKDAKLKKSNVVTKELQAATIHINNSLEVQNKNNNEIKFPMEKYSSIKIIKSKSRFSIYPSSKEMNDWKNLIESLLKKDNLKTYILSRKRQSFASLDELKSFLLKSPAKSDIEKAWCVYLWITHNIDYNFNGYLNGNYGNQDINSVFKTGLSVCSGYGKLSEELFGCFNIKSMIIGGYAKGYGYKIGEKLTKVNHDWNAVFINNKWNLIESTWGAGFCDSKSVKYVRSFEPYYFFTPAEVFIYQHLPENSAHQFLKNPLSLNDFEALQKCDLTFFKNGFKSLSHFRTLIEPECSNFNIEFEAPIDIKMIGSLKNMKGIEIENSVFIQRNYKTKNYIVEISLQSNEATQLFLFGDKDGSKTYNGICEYLVKPESLIEKKNALFCKTFSFPSPIYLFEPKKKKLVIGKDYIFKVYVNAIKVALVNTQKDWFYFTKDSIDENIWVYKYTPTLEGSLILYAKLVEEKSFSAAFEYTVSRA